MHQKDSQGLAHDLAAAANNHIAPGGVVPVAEQQLLDACRGARHENGPALDQQAKVVGMDAVNVLGPA